MKSKSFFVPFFKTSDALQILERFKKLIIRIKILYIKRNLNDYTFQSILVAVISSQINVSKVAGLFNIGPKLMLRLAPLNETFTQWKT